MRRLMMIMLLVGVLMSPLLLAGCGDDDDADTLPLGACQLNIDCRLQ